MKSSDASIQSQQSSQIPSAKRHQKKKKIKTGIALQIMLGIGLQVLTPGLQAEPKEGSVVSGSASINKTSPDRLDVIQSTDKAIINWREFSIGAKEHVNFQQPSSGSATLNRVTGDQVSQILGRLTANGNVLLINPNGILFGKDSRVDVAGLIATTSDIRNDHFMAGKLEFFNSSAVSGMISNQGTITAAEGGLVALVARGVENSGVIEARLGRITLAAGNRFTVDLYGDKLISLAVDDKIAQQLVDLDGKLLTAAVSNSGVLSADGGAVLLSATVAKNLVDTVINMDGYIQAKTVGQQDGQIVLEGGDSGTVKVAGLMDASGKSGGESGGAVHVLGEKVVLASNTKVDVSGDQGGGTALIGGDFQGKGLPAASNTTVDKNASVVADAITQGNGGKVIVWANETTRFHGAISARGGANGGNGGFAEVSGKQNLAFDGSVSLRAPNGNNGTLLLDPENIVINDDQSSSGTLEGDPSEIQANAVSIALNNGTNVRLAADNDITVDAPITAFVFEDTPQGNASLTMEAGRDISVNSSINTVGPIDLAAGRNVNVDDTIRSTGPITLTSRSLEAGTGITIGADIYSFDITLGPSENLIIASSDVITLNGPVLEPEDPLQVFTRATPNCSLGLCGPQNPEGLDLVGSDLVLDPRVPTPPTATPTETTPVEPILPPEITTQPNPQPPRNPEGAIPQAPNVLANAATILGAGIASLNVDEKAKGKSKQVGLPSLTGEPSPLPIPVIEMGMHIGPITSLAVDYKNLRLLSASADKTARVWDIKTGRLINVLRGPIGEGQEGRLNVAALSPDGRIAAVGGWTGWEWDNQGSVYLFDVTTGEILMRLSRFPATIENLAFSETGSYLVVTLADGKGIQVYDAATYTVVAQDTDYQGSVTGVDFSPSGKLAVSSSDGYIRLYDNAFRLIKKKPLEAGKLPTNLYFSPDGKEVAVGFQDAPALEILSGDNLDQRHIARLKEKSGALGTVAWSPDGEYLYAGGAPKAQASTLVYRFSKKGKGSYQAIPVGSEKISDLQALPDGQFVIATADPSIGVFDKAGKKVWMKEAQNVDLRNSAGKLLVSNDGAGVQFPFSNNRNGYFAVQLRELSTKAGSTSAAAPILESSGLALTDWKNQPQPKLNGKPLALEPNERIRTYAISPDHQRLLAGTARALRVYDARGNELWKTPVGESVEAVNINGNNDFAIAALADGTVHWYRLADGAQILTLLPHANGQDWVAWTPEGYYISSPNGDRYLGWNFNQGKDKASEFYRAVQYDRALYRPDYVAAYFNSKGSSATAKQIFGRSEVDIADLKDIAPPKITIDPSQVTLIENGTKARIRFAAAAEELPMQDFAVYVNNIPVTPHKDRFIPKDRSTLFDRELEIPLLSKENNIKVEVFNGVSIGVAETYVVAPQAIKQEVGDLYVLAIGVNEFEGLPKQSHLDFAAQDAAAISQTLRKNGKFYRKVFTKVVADKGESLPLKENIIQNLDFINQARAQDTVVIFLASHGLSDKTGDYYFVPRDASPNDVSAVKEGTREAVSTGVNSLLRRDVFFDALRGTAGRRLLIVDTCQAKQIEGNVDVQSLAKRSASSSFSLMVASQGDELSQEYPKGGHGLFTYSLLRALSGQGDANKDKRVSLSETYNSAYSFVKNNYDKRAGEQTPELIAPTELKDMVLVGY